MVKIALSVMLFGLVPLVANAQDKTCDVTGLKGAFGYRVTGNFWDNQGYLYFIGATGRMVADGAGALTGAHTYNFDGTAVKQQYTGTYTVDADCTGSLTITPTSGNAMHFDFVIVNDGQQIELVETDTSFIVSGAMKLQSSTAAQTQTTTPTPATPVQ